MSPSRNRITSPGTSSRAGGVIHAPSRLDPGLDRQLGLQSVDRVTRLVFLPEPDHPVGHQQHQDDEEVGPVPDRADRTAAISIIHGIGPQK